MRRSHGLQRRAHAHQQARAPCNVGLSIRPPVVPGAAMIAVALTLGMAWPSVRTPLTGRFATAPCCTATMGSARELLDEITPSAVAAKPVTWFSARNGGPDRTGSGRPEHMAAPVAGVAMRCYGVTMADAAWRTATGAHPSRRHQTHQAAILQCRALGTI